MKYCVRIALKGTTNNLLIVACQKCGVSIKPLEVLSQKQVLLCTSSIKNVYRMDHYYWKSFYFFFNSYRNLSNKCVGRSSKAKYDSTLEPKLYNCGFGLKTRQILKKLCQFWPFMIALSSSKL